MATSNDKVAAKDSWAPPADRLPGEYASYRLHGRLGAGGFGTVYSATCPKFPNVLVALKFLSAGPAADLARTEARAGLLLAHPNFVRTFEFLDLRPYQAALLLNPETKGTSVSFHAVSV